jgi:AcrR family transcriptional regulator
LPRKEKRVRRAPEEARRLILDAAEKIGGATGPAGLRLQDVAREAGVSHPTILHHFGSREGLIRALNDRAAQELTRSLLGRMSDGASDGKGIAEVFAAYRGGLAERTVWLLQSGAMPEPGASPLLAEVLAAMQAERARHARPGHAPDIADSRNLLNLVAVAALGDALIGARLRAGSGAPEPEASRDFEKFLAGLVSDFLKSKT